MKWGVGGESYRERHRQEREGGGLHNTPSHLVVATTDLKNSLTTRTDNFWVVCGH